VSNPHQTVPAWVAVTLPKAGNSPSENEDAHATDGTSRFAVADGASEGWASGSWAARLVSRFVAAPPAPSAFDEWLRSARAGYAAPAPTGPLAWYAEEKQRDGAFATLLGLELRPTASGWAWKVIAVGDSCLFHLRGGTLVTAVPLERTEQFGTRPALVPSAPDARCPEPEWFAGRAEPGDLFLLATDAASARVLAPDGVAAADRAARAALAARAPDPLRDWCAQARAAINDDVTVLAILLPPSPEAK
jgi:serine/threonine protein phosphatase PrpC